MVVVTRPANSSDLFLVWPVYNEARGIFHLIKIGGDYWDHVNYIISSSFKKNILGKNHVVAYVGN